MTNEDSFMSLFTEKLRDIKDVCEGKTASLMNMDTTMEDREVIDETQLWDMFENIKKQVLNLGIASSGVSAEIESSSKDIKDTIIHKRWFQGSYYICKICNRKEYGDTMFKSHLKKEHGMTTKDTRNLSDFFSHYEQLEISCKLCQKVLNHDYSSLCQHIKRQHFMSIVDYEAQYITGRETPVPLEPDSSLAVEERTEASQEPESVPLPAPEKRSRPILKILSPSLINGMIEKNISLLENIQAVPPNTMNPQSGGEKVSKSDPAISEETKKPVGKVNTSVMLSDQPRPSLEITGAVETPAELQEVVAVKREPMEHVARTRTLYYCPFKSVESLAENCKFFTTKQGFLNNDASRHISEVHKLTKQDIAGMKPGQCKFQKVKVERE